MNDTDQIIPLRGIRGMTASKMVKSLQEAAQLTHHASCDVSALLEKKRALADRGENYSIEDLLMYDVIQVLGRHPDINAVVADKEIQLSKSVNLGLAIALPGNLLVAPCIFDAQKLDLSAIRTARQDLADRAKVNKLSVKEMTGGTFTISNLGLTRVEQFTPILNAPQVGILGVGRIVERAVRSGEGLDWMPYMGLSFTFDPRAIDGAPAADFLTDLCETIEGLNS